MVSHPKRAIFRDVFQQSFASLVGLSGHGFGLPFSLLSFELALKNLVQRGIQRQEMDRLIAKREKMRALKGN
jgi:hypothetical protein